VWTTGAHERGQKARPCLPKGGGYLEEQIREIRGGISEAAEAQGQDIGMSNTIR
jgi:hypothetical protein